MQYAGIVCGDANASGRTSAGCPPVQAALVTSPTLANGGMAQVGGVSTTPDRTKARTTQVPNSMAPHTEMVHLLAMLNCWECVLHLL